MNLRLTALTLVNVQIVEMDIHIWVKTVLKTIPTVGMNMNGRNMDLSSEYFVIRRKGKESGKMSDTRFEDLESAKKFMDGVPHGLFSFIGLYQINEKLRVIKHD